MAHWVREDEFERWLEGIAVDGIDLEAIGREAMKKALGGEQEAEAFLAKWGASYKVGQNRMLKYRPKLSDYGDEK